MKTPQRIHIIGATGSGKTTSASVLSKELGIQVYELDKVMWSGSVEFAGKNPPEIRDQLLTQIVFRDTWIVEGVYYKWVTASFDRADLIIYIDTNTYTRHIRIVLRFLKQRLGFEKSIYKQTFLGLWKMLSWNHTFDKADKHKILKILEEYQEKLIVIQNSQDILNVIR